MKYPVLRKIQCLIYKLTALVFLIFLSGSIKLNREAEFTKNHVIPLEEIDPESGAVSYLIGPDERPADNIYGEQPYGDPSGRRIVIRYYSTEDKPGGLSIIDLIDGSKYDILKGNPRFPAFHSWGDYIFYQEQLKDKLVLKRCNYLTLKTKKIAVLPPERGSYSYGTISQDYRYYAVSVRPETFNYSQVHLLDLKTGRWSLLLDKEGYHAKHEQFSRDGRNKVLIQLNQMPDVKQVLLGELDVNGEEKLFPADRPYTPRPTGHETWIGNTGSIFFSTAVDPGTYGNIWTAAVGDNEPVKVYDGELRFGHVSVSNCGRFWIGDTGEKGIPVYIGSFASGKCKRVVFTKTEYDGKQWAHAHPYLTADNKWLIFTARRNGLPQVYGAKLKEGWLEELDKK